MLRAKEKSSVFFDREEKKLRTARQQDQMYSRTNFFIFSVWFPSLPSNMLQEHYTRIQKPLSMAGKAKHHTRYSTDNNHSWY